VRAPRSHEEIPIVARVVRRGRRRRLGERGHPRERFDRTGWLRPGRRQQGLHRGSHRMTIPSELDTRRQVWRERTPKAPAMRSGRQIALLLNLQTRGGATAARARRRPRKSRYERSIRRGAAFRSGDSGLRGARERWVSGSSRATARASRGSISPNRKRSRSPEWSTVADALGVGSAAAGAERKLLAAIPPSAATKARRTRARIHFDLGSLVRCDRDPAATAAARASGLDQRRIRIDYTSWTARRKREVDPLGPC